MEIKTIIGWERVHLENQDGPQDYGKELLGLFEGAPHRTMLIRGDFTRRTWAFGQGHVSRGFLVLGLDAKPNADDPNRSLSP